MDLGLGNYNDVKTFVLPQSMWNSADVDAQYGPVLQSIASGVAGRFEKYTNRKLGFVAADQAVFDARRTHYLLPRYPIVSVALLEMNDTAQDDWTDITTAIVQQDFAIGWIYFGCYVGDPICMVRCTYTGGFFYETKEPTDAGFPTAVPAGAALLPGDLKDAWLKQILHEFELKDRLLPQGLGETGKANRSNWRLDQMQLLPEVANAIAQYRRYQIIA